MNPSREKQGMHLPRFESGSKIANCEPPAAVLPVLCFLSKFGMFQAGGSHISSNDHHCWGAWVLYDIQNIYVRLPYPDSTFSPSFISRDEEDRETSEFMRCPTPKFWALQRNLSLSSKLNLTFKFEPSSSSENVTIPLRLFQTLWVLTTKNSQILTLLTSI